MRSFSFVLTIYSQVHTAHLHWSWFIYLLFEKKKVGIVFFFVWQPWLRGYCLFYYIIMFGHCKHSILLAICLLLVMLINKWLNNALLQLAFHYVKMVVNVFFPLILWKLRSIHLYCSIIAVLFNINPVEKKLKRKDLNAPPQNALSKSIFGIIHCVNQLICDRMCVTCKNIWYGQ